jgi:hypothetical protein
MGQGPQDNESAAEQAKDEVISDMIRDKYKVSREGQEPANAQGATGSDFPIADKEQKFGQM